MKVKVISLPYIFQVLYVLCFTRPRYQVSVYRTIGPLVVCVVLSGFEIRSLVLIVSVSGCCFSFAFGTDTENLTNVVHVKHDTNISSVEFLLRQTKIYQQNNK